MAPGTYYKLNNFWLNERMSGLLQERLYKSYNDWIKFQPKYTYNELVAL